MKNPAKNTRKKNRKRSNKYAKKHLLQLKGIFYDTSPLPNYRLKDITLSNGLSVKIKIALIESGKELL